MCAPIPKCSASIWVRKHERRTAAPKALSPAVLCTEGLPMSLLTPERLYRLLPAIHRLRDAEQGEPLRALLAVVEHELETLEADTARLYDNWFIETCEPWVVPYLGELLGVRGLHGVSDATFNQRAQVANTLRFRRRKGTAAMLEQLARDVTGWPARVTLRATRSIA